MGHRCPLELGTLLTSRTTTKLRVLKNNKQGPALEAAGELCPLKTSSKGTSLDLNTARNGTPLPFRIGDTVDFPNHNGTPMPRASAQLHSHKKFQKEIPRSHKKPPE
ncbi:uncharacterized protein LOC142775207 [Rhipicephalus microplus]|uniref:uncharacterized protein LOC142775207 n=1 Tax=Rhipicephalus microplus TaxID=6941 RepID=UPI003F6B68D0